MQTPVKRRLFVWAAICILQTATVQCSDDGKTVLRSTGFNKKTSSVQMSNNEIKENGEITGEDEDPSLLMFLIATGQMDPSVLKSKTTRTVTSSKDGEDDTPKTSHVEGVYKTPSGDREIKGVSTSHQTPNSRSSAMAFSSGSKGATNRVNAFAGGKSARTEAPTTEEPEATTELEVEAETESPKDEDESEPVTTPKPTRSTVEPTRMSTNLRRILDSIGGKRGPSSIQDRSQSFFLSEPETSGEKWKVIEGSKPSENQSEEETGNTEPESVTEPEEEPSTTTPTPKPTPKKKSTTPAVKKLTTKRAQPTQKVQRPKPVETNDDQPQFQEYQSPKQAPTETPPPPEDAQPTPQVSKSLDEDSNPGGFPSGSPPMYFHPMPFQPSGFQFGVPGGMMGGGYMNPMGGSQDSSMQGNSLSQAGRYPMGPPPMFSQQQNSFSTQQRNSFTQQQSMMSFGPGFMMPGVPSAGSPVMRQGVPKSESGKTRFTYSYPGMGSPQGANGMSYGSPF